VADLVNYRAGWPDIIRAEAIVEIKSDKTLRGRAVILAKKPDSFRIEVLGPFGRLIALLLSDGDDLTVFANGGLKTYKWNDPALPYQFTSEEFVSFLLGKNDWASPNPDASAGSTYKITRNESGNIANLVKFKKGSPILSVGMSDYKAASGYVVPHRISLKDSRRTLSIRYTGIEINPEIRDDIFGINKVFP
jgi:outer membrane lipoprotein-sorting protein